MNRDEATSCTPTRRTRRRSTIVPDGSNFGGSCPENGGKLIGLIPRRISARFSFRCSKDKVAEIGPSPAGSPTNRPPSPWSSVGRIFNERWPSVRRKFSKRHGKRTLSDSGVELSQDETGSSPGSRDATIRADPDEAVRLLREQLAEASSTRKKPGVANFQIVSKAGTRGGRFALTSDTTTSIDVCKEYIGHLKCYDASPRWTELIAIDSSMPIDQVFHIMRFRQRTTNAVVWDSAQSVVRGVCDLQRLSEFLWRDPESIVERINRPMAHCFDGQLEHRFFADTELMKAAGILSEGGRGRESSNSAATCVSRSEQLYLAIFDESTGDVVSSLSAVDIVRFQSRQVSECPRLVLSCHVTGGGRAAGRRQHMAYSVPLLQLRAVGSILFQICKFQLHTNFDHLQLADLLPDDPLIVSSLDLRSSIRDAMTRLIASPRSALAVMKADHLGGTQPRVETAITIVDLIDFVLRQRGRWCESVLDKSLRELLVRMPKKNFQTYDTRTPLSHVLRSIAASPVTRSSVDPMEPLGILVDEKGYFVGLLHWQDVLRAIVELKNPSDKNMQRQDSGVGEDMLEIV